MRFATANAIKLAKLHMKIFDGTARLCFVGRQNFPGGQVPAVQDEGSAVAWGQETSATTATQ